MNVIFDGYPCVPFVALSTDMVWRNVDDLDHNSAAYTKSRNKGR